MSAHSVRISYLLLREIHINTVIRIVVIYSVRFSHRNEEHQVENLFPRYCDTKY